SSDWGRGATTAAVTVAARSPTSDSATSTSAGSGTSTSRRSTTDTTRRGTDLPVTGRAAWRLSPREFAPRLPPAVVPAAEVAVTAAIAAAVVPAAEVAVTAAITAAVVPAAEVAIAP